MRRRTLHLLAFGLLAIGVTQLGARQWLGLHGADEFSHAPCAIPVHYAVGQVDPRFGFDDFTVTAALAEAASVWHTAADTMLFIESDHPRAMQVELLFDERQQAALARHSLRGGLESDQRILEAEEAELEQWGRRIEASRAARDRVERELASRVQRHEAEVAAWNAGTGDRSEARRRAIETEADTLRVELAELEQQTRRLNDEIQAYNRRVEQARSRADDFRARVETYNQASSPIPVESGRYSYDRESGRRIAVYRAESYAELVWVLAHEFGHALGIGHVDEPGAIMHALLHDGAGPQADRARPVVLGPADEAALREVCGQRLR